MRRALATTTPRWALWQHAKNRQRDTLHTHRLCPVPLLESYVPFLLLELCAFRHHLIFKLVGAALRTQGSGSEAP